MSRNLPFIIRNGTWHADYQHRGERIRYTLGLPASAPERRVWEKFERLEAERLESKTRRPIVPALARFLEAKRANRNPKTAERYDCVIGKFDIYLGEQRLQYLDQLSPQLFNDYAARLRAAGQQPAGVNTELTHLRACLNTLNSWGLMPASYNSRHWFTSAYFRDIPKRQRIYSAPELRALFADPQFGDLYRFLYLSGQRIGVVLQLHTSHVNRDRGVISFARGKRGQLQEIPLTPQIRAHLDTLDPGANGYFFWADSRPLPTPTRINSAVSGVGGNLRRILRAGKYPPGRVHDIRATTATHLAPLMTMPELMNFLGWTEPATALLYYRQRPEDLAVPDLPAAPATTSSHPIRVTRPSLWLANS